MHNQRLPQMRYHRRGAQTLKVSCFGPSKTLCSAFGGSIVSALFVGQELFPCRHYIFLPILFFIETLTQGRATNRIAHFSIENQVSRFLV